MPIVLRSMGIDARSQTGQVGYYRAGAGGGGYGCHETGERGEEMNNAPTA